MKNTLVSIIIPCYNHGQYIDEAIKSVEECQSDDYEIIIINDGSTDDFTNNRLIELKNEGYQVIFQENQGLGRSRNNGIKLAKGKYILPLDADNKVTPEFISKAKEILDSDPSISIVYTNRQLFGDSNDLLKVGEFNLFRITEGNYIDACAIYRKTVWEKVGGYDENMPLQGWEDWDFWLSAAKMEFRFFYIPELLFFYRVVENSMIQQLGSNPKIDVLIEYLYKKHISLLLKHYRANNDELCQLRSIKNDSNILNFERKHPLRTSVKYIYRWLSNK